jgi:hypothetical protein
MTAQPGQQQMAQQSLTMEPWGTGGPPVSFIEHSALQQILALHCVHLNLALLPRLSTQHDQWKYRDDAAQHLGMLMMTLIVTLLTVAMIVAMPRMIMAMPSTRLSIPEPGLCSSAMSWMAQGTQ